MNGVAMFCSTSGVVDDVNMSIFVGYVCGEYGGVTQVPFFAGACSIFRK